MPGSNICTAANSVLFYHFVGPGEQRRPHIEAERLRGFEIDDQLELGRLLYRQITGLRALENSINIGRSAAVLAALCAPLLALAVTGLFSRYAADKEIASLADIREALQKPNDRRYIERALKAEIIAAKFGFDASYPFRLQGDNQIEKALEVLPESQKLALKAAEMRGHAGSGATDAGSARAQASPKTK